MSEISDQISERCIVLSVQNAKFDARILAKAMKAVLKGSGKLAKKITSSKNMANKGKQTVKQLTKQGQGVSNIEINDGNIKSFESVARKYGVDYALMKDKTESPPKWLVFFKARDADALTSAFKEFTAKEAKRSIAKPSVLEALSKMAELVKTQVFNRVKNKSRGAHEL
jgi:hypothetical protein